MLGLEEHEEQLRGAHYTSPDAELPAKLAAVDWTQEKTVLYVGKLLAGKGVHDLLLALPAVLREAPNLRLVLVGESTFRETLEILLMALATEGAIQEEDRPDGDEAGRPRCIAFDRREAEHVQARR